MGSEQRVFILVPRNQLNPFRSVTCCSSHLLLSSFPLSCIHTIPYHTIPYHSAMPVLERGTGLDRSFHKLPVLLVDDFAMITPDLLRQVRRDCTGEPAGSIVVVYAIALRSIASDCLGLAHRTNEANLPHINTWSVLTSYRTSHLLCRHMWKRCITQRIRRVRSGTIED